MLCICIVSMQALASFRFSPVICIDIVCSRACSVCLCVLLRLGCMNAFKHKIVVCFLTHARACTCDCRIHDCILGKFLSVMSTNSPVVDHLRRERAAVVRMHVPCCHPNSSRPCCPFRGLMGSQDGGASLALAQFDDLGQDLLDTFTFPNDGLASPDFDLGFLDPEYDNIQAFPFIEASVVPYHGLPSYSGDGTRHCCQVARGVLWRPGQHWHSITCMFRVSVHLYL